MLSILAGTLTNLGTNGVDWYIKYKKNYLITTYLKQMLKKKGWLKKYRKHRTIKILWFLIEFSVSLSMSLNIGSNYVCAPFPRTEKFSLKTILLNYAVFP